VSGCPIDGRELLGHKKISYDTVKGPEGDSANAAVPPQHIGPMNVVVM
jgi:hypothetical protein